MIRDLILFSIFVKQFSVYILIIISLLFAADKLKDLKIKHTSIFAEEIENADKWGLRKNPLEITINQDCQDINNCIGI